MAARLAPGKRVTSRDAVLTSPAMKGSRPGVWVLVLAVLAACAAAERPPAATQSHPEVRGSPVERNAACEGCHADVAREWRASLHMKSHSDPAYQRAFVLEPLAFCTKCHAPEADAEAPQADRAAIGTACVTCHSGGASSTAARPCAECHEFAFPDGKGLMQLTATEHRASMHAGTRCAACHMPRTGRRMSHVFSASRDPDMLKRAADVRATRGADDVRIAFTQREVGHAFPTGDIFRRLRVDVWVAGDRAAPKRVFLQRNTKTDAPDTRPFSPGAPSEVRVAISAPGKSIEWSVHYERVEHPTSVDETDAVVDGSIEIASGVLAP